MPPTIFSLTLTLRLRVRPTLTLTPLSQPSILLLLHPSLFNNHPSSSTRSRSRSRSRTLNHFPNSISSDRPYSSFSSNHQSNYLGISPAIDPLYLSVLTPHFSPLLARLRTRLKSTSTNWRPIPLWIGASLLALLAYLKNQDRGSTNEPNRPAGIKIEGPWQVHVLGALPLRSISRLYGSLNSYTLPVWFRVPGYKLYSWIFGVNLSEAEIEDLKEYRSLNDFFLRRLKPDARPIDPLAILVSPADGRIVNFGTIEGRRVASVKGLSYSVDALLLGHADHLSQPARARSTEESSVSDAQFAKINDIPYSVDELMGSGQGPDAGQPTDASLGASTPSVGSAAKVHTDVVRGELERAPRTGHRMCFLVVYLAPGDYHRFHSPADWNVERRRHFAGELFSVSPWMAGKLADLFVLNERVALLGKWRHGFFSMTPVGATNVGSILIHFDRELRTNTADRQCHAEAVYGKGLLAGQVLRKGDEVGAFSLGSTIVLVFEAPDRFEFLVKKGDLVKVGQAIGNV